MDKCKECKWFIERDRKKGKIKMKIAGEKQIIPWVEIRGYCWRLPEHKDIHDADSHWCGEFEPKESEVKE